MNEKFHDIKITRNKNTTEKILIDGIEIKGVTRVQVCNSSNIDGQADNTSIIIEIGHMKSLEIVGD